MTRPPLDCDRAVAENLWTRRSALALTAGFLALGGSRALAAPFAQVPQPRANHLVVSKTNRVLALMAGATTLKRYRVHLGFAPEGHKVSSGDGRTPEGRYWIDRRNPRSDFYLSLGISYPNAVDVARARALGRGAGRQHLHPRRPARPRRPPQEGLDRRLHRGHRPGDRGDLVDGPDRDPDHHPRLSAARPGALARARQQPVIEREPPRAPCHDRRAPSPPRLCAPASRPAP